VSTLDPEARFLELVEAHRRILYKVARAYGRSGADAEDLAQEMVVQLWRSFPRYDPAFKFSTWMYRIALNVAISWLRRERTQTRHRVADGEQVLLALRTPEPEAGASAEDLALLYAAIARFEPLDRALLMLYLDGVAQQEIGSVLGITTTNVATKIGRLKERLRADFRAAGHL
jgi:RNA polymerase sigma-70 factor (ECF subfamily)